MTSDESILRLVSGAKLEFVCPVWQNSPKMPISCSTNVMCQIDKELAKYLRLGIIEYASHSRGEFVNQIFPVPKRSGGIRIILNLKPLNGDIVYKHFKMENFATVLELIEKNCYMASIDLQDAYYSVNIDKSDRKYLRFTWKNSLYQFTCLPNGLASAPRWYTKLLKPVFSHLRNTGLVSVYYLDDTWLMGRSKEECEANVAQTHQMLVDTGFLINKAKSQMLPSQAIQFLGFEIDSRSMTVSLPMNKRLELLQLCQTLLLKEVNTIRFVAKVIGKLVSSLPAVQFGALFYRYLEIDKISNLRSKAGNFDAPMKLGNQAKDELRWWINNALTCSRPINIPAYTVMMATDASRLGWGAVLNGQATGGRWSEEELKRHINELEILAILFGLQSFSSHLTQEHVRIQSDNVTAVSYINNLGGVKSIPCHDLVKKIWLWALSRNIFLSAEHLPGSTNVLADKASRVFDDNTEWSLDSSVYDQVLQEFGPFSIDLFASRLNTKHSMYVSWKPDPSALFIDAFTRDWSSYGNFYAFPPFSVILKCLHKISVEAAQGILIVPLWPTQPWFPKLMRMVHAPPLILPKDILHLPFNNLHHSQRNSLHLLACRISGIVSKVRDFQATLSQSSVLHGGNPQLNSMKDIINSGFISVVNGKLIPCTLMR